MTLIISTGPIVILLAVALCFITSVTLSIMMGMHLGEGVSFLYFFLSMVAWFCMALFLILGSHLGY